MPKNTAERSIDRPYTPIAGHSAVTVASGTPGITDHGALAGLADDDHLQYLTVGRGGALYVPLTRQVIAGSGLSGGGSLVGDVTLAVNVAAPLAITADTVGLTYGTGLTLSGSTLIADLGAGLTLGANKIVVDYLASLALTGNQIGVNKAHDFAWTGTHSWAEGEVLQSAGEVRTPGLRPGYGWSITNTIGTDAALTIPNIWVGNLHAQAFILDTARVDVGEEIWARSRATLYTDLVTPAVSSTATMVVEVPPGIDGIGAYGDAFHLFGDGHYVRLRIFDSTQGLTIADAWGTVVYVSADAGGDGEPDTQTYTFTMLYGTEGATIRAGALVLGYGTPGDSFVLLTTVKNGAPYQEFLRWGIVLETGAVDPTAVPWNDDRTPPGTGWQTMTRIGNLAGITDDAFGGALTGAGLYGSNVYLTGALRLVGDAPGAGPDTAGLYAYGDKLGYWDGAAWTMYQDDGGNFTFKAGADSEGSTRLTYNATASILGGERYSESYTPPGWRYTWWADADTGTFHAGPAGEVILHDYGMSLVGYTGTDISPLYNTKSLAFFRDQSEALTNVNLAHARIWGGVDMDKDSVDALADPESMLQLEIGVDTNGAIASADRPHIALMYMPEMAVAHQDRFLSIKDWNWIELIANKSPGFNAILLEADVTTVIGDLSVQRLWPHAEGTKQIGTSGTKFEDIYVKRLHADTVEAPAFVGQNTVGAKVRLGGTSLNHSTDLISPWTEIRDDSGFYSGGANDRLSADVDNWYTLTLTLISSTQNDPHLWVEVNDGIMLWETVAYGGHGVVSGMVYLSAGDYVRGYVTTSGVTTIDANMTIVRSGTQGGTPSTDAWAGNDTLVIQTDYNGDGGVHVTNAHAGGTVTLTVDGNIIATSFNGRDLGAAIDDGLAAAAVENDNLYLTKNDASTTYATIAYTDGLVNPLSARVTTLEGADPYSQYVSVSAARTVTAVHTFNPASSGAPFVLGANASGQRVVGFNADYLDGHHWSEVLSSPAGALAALLTVDGAGSALDADLLDGLQGAAYALAATAVTAGDGLAGGGTLASPFGISLALPGTLTATTINTAAGSHVHAIDATIARSAITLTAGAGLLATGTGDLTANRTFDVGAGTGITVNANDVAVATGYAFTWTGAHAFQSTITARHISPEATDTYDLGTATKLWRKGWLSELDAILFAQNTITLVGGWMMLSKGEGAIPADVGDDPDNDTIIDFGDGAGLVQHDFVLFRAAGAMEYMQVGANVSGNVWNVTRNLDGSGANAWPGGSVYANLGYTGNGRVEFNAIDTPRISIISQGNAYNTQTEVIRLGDLNGLTGVTSQKWGIHIGDDTQYLRYMDGALTVAGSVTATTGTIGGWTLGATSLTAGSGANTVGLDSGGTNPALYAGSATPGSAPFRVTKAGALTATDATITGAITASSGSITGALTIGANGSITLDKTVIDKTGIVITGSNTRADESALRFKMSDGSAFGGVYQSGLGLGIYANSTGSSYITANTNSFGVVDSRTSGTYVATSQVSAGNGSYVAEIKAIAGASASYVLLQPLGGNVGIGTTGPLSIFHVKAGTNKNLRIRPHSDWDGGYTGVAIHAINDADNANVTLAIESNILAINTATGGNVGIGTTAPTSKLHVTGLPSYDSQAAAGSAGLTPGALFIDSTNFSGWLCVKL